MFHSRAYRWHARPPLLRTGIFGCFIVVACRWHARPPPDPKAVDLTDALRQPILCERQRQASFARVAALMGVGVVGFPCGAERACIVARYLVYAATDRSRADASDGVLIATNCGRACACHYMMGSATNVCVLTAALVIICANAVHIPTAENAIFAVIFVLSPPDNRRFWRTGSRCRSRCLTRTKRMEASGQNNPSRSRPAPDRGPRKRSADDQALLLSCLLRLR